MNAGITMTLHAIRQNLERMDRFLAEKMSDEAKSALDDARREAGILQEMLNTVHSSWEIFADRSKTP